MTRRTRRLAVLVTLAVLTAACGDSGADDQAGGATDVTDRGDDAGAADTSQDTDGGAGAEDGSAAIGDGDGGAPNLDPASMPPAGEVVFELDGEVFSIRADAMDYFICDLDEAFVNVRSESATQSLTVQLDTQSGRGNADLTANGSDVRYDSFFGPETAGGVAVDAPHLVYEGRFDASRLDDPGDITDVGIGRVSVTCP